MLSSVPSREPLAKKDTSQAGRAGQTRPGRLTGQESNKWSAVSVSVCLCLYLFLFSPAVESARNELGETLEGPVPPALAVILRAKYLQIRTASTKAPPPPPQKGYRRLVLMVTPPCGRLAGYGTGPPLTACPV